jgi:putative membrane protein
MAGILYFYRLFVYHFDFGQKNEAIHSLFSLMELRLFKFITVPAMILSVLSGIIMISINPLLLSQKWFQIKLTGAVLMIFSTIYGLPLMKNFRNKRLQGYTSKQLRFLNEVPTLLMILIVVMVIMRPFGTW